MSTTLTNMGLVSWTSGNDFFSSSDLSANWSKVDAHDHTTGKGVQIPTAGLANGAVTGAKLAADAVDGSKILDGSVNSAELASNAVTNVKILDGAVTTTKILDANVTAAKIASASAPNSITLTAGSWTSQSVNYFKDQLGFVRIRGQALASSTGTIAAGSTLLTLPTGFRPLAQVLALLSFGGGVITVSINTDGTIKNVLAVTQSTTQAVGFDSIVPFRTDA